MKHLFHTYCRTTSMHGFRHISDSNSSLIEKCIWVTICSASVVFCLTLMILSYQSTQDRLTIMHLVDRDTPLNELNFPAITICNYNRVYKPAADRMAKKLLRGGYDSGTVDKFFQNLSALIRPLHKNCKQDDKTLLRYNEMLYTLGSDLRNVMFQLMQPCENMLKLCTFNGISYKNCSALFEPVVSYMGHCCGFNYHVAPTYADKNYSPQCLANYRRHKSNMSRIEKTPGPGRDVGLTVELDAGIEMQAGSIRNYVGIAVIVHESRDYPETEILTTSVSPSQELDVVLSGMVIQGLDEIRGVKITGRKCIFLNEINFEYSYQSCITGCKMRRILAACNCIPYYYPATCLNISELCDFKDIRCIKNHQFEITSLHKEIKLPNNKILERCHCNETCDKIYYNLWTDKNSRRMPRNMIPPWLQSERESVNFSKVNIYFQDYGYNKYELGLFMTWNDLIANLGGLIGFCLGGSVISLMEPIIYVLLTPFRRAQRRKVRPSEKEYEKPFGDCRNNKDGIFTVQGNSETSGNRRRKHLISIKEKYSGSQNLELLRKHFMRLDH